VAASLPAIKKETTAKSTPPVSGADLPGISTSKINVDAKPIYEPAGKPITQVNIDEGILDEKPSKSLD
jgi:pre-mRNA 3'-end-processing factor FIP1